MVTGAGGDVLPVVLLDREGRTVDLAWVDEKGFRKSLESGELWTVNRETGRLLPYNGKTPIASIESQDGWYAAVLTENGAASSRAERSETEAITDANTKTEAATESGAPAERPPGADGVLETLAAVVGRRKREQPEGSYTTYLFREGIEKIRKKTGEEAVELILARERGEMIHEAADLIYHLMVLLEASDIPFREILDELEKRTR